MKEFDSKVVLITGATSGIGRETALLYAAHGAKLSIVGRNIKAGEDLKNIIIKKGIEVIFIKADSTIDDEVQNAVNKTTNKYGKIDILFNNIGFEGVLKSIQNLSSPEWDEILNINLKSAFLFSKYTIPYMIKHQSGCIINNSSGLGLSFRNAENYVSYATAKGGLIAFTKALAIEVAKYNIRVNVVCPGDVETPMVDREIEKWISLGRYKNKKEAILEIIKSSPLKKIAKPCDVAYSVLFLSSEKANYITGAVLIVDGGGSLI